MASELPYYKFEVLAYLTGDISLESWELQGIFNNICAFYWSKNCDLSLGTLYKKYRGSEKLIDELISLDVLKKDGEYLSISFLNEQWASKETQKMVNAINGKKGGRPKKEIELTRLYIIQCFDDKEQFLKIGITTSTIANRFSSTTGNNAVMPYSYKVLLDQVLENHLAIEIEKSVKVNFKSYDPKIQFGGCVYECFSMDKLGIVELIKDAILFKSVVDLNPNGLILKTNSVNFANQTQTNIEDSKEDYIIEEEIKEDYNKDDLVFSSLKSDLIDALVIHFGFTEMRFANSQKQIFQFVNTQMKNEEDVAHFENQFKNYQEYKKLSKETIHNFTGFLGTPAMQFQNAAWNSENWAEKLIKFKNSSTSASKGKRTADIYNQIKNPYE